eukprot:6206661-Pleurochrysis_carterae.AAC.1
MALQEALLRRVIRGSGVRGARRDGQRGAASAEARRCEHWRSETEAGVDALPNGRTFARSAEASTLLRAARHADDAVLRAAQRPVTQSWSCTTGERSELQCLRRML